MSDHFVVMIVEVDKGCGGRLPSGVVLFAGLVKVAWLTHDTPTLCNCDGLFPAVRFDARPSPMLEFICPTADRQLRSSRRIRCACSRTNNRGQIVGQFDDSSGKHMGFSGEQTVVIPPSTIRTRRSPPPDGQRVAGGARTGDTLAVGDVGVGRLVRPFGTCLVESIRLGRHRR